MFFSITHPQFGHLSTFPTYSIFLALDSVVFGVDELFVTFVESVETVLFVIDKKSINIILKGF